MLTADSPEKKPKSETEMLKNEHPYQYTSSPKQLPTEQSSLFSFQASLTK